ncbi:MAG: TolC family protein [Verrucomicrobia bacterium]|nr:MAG: TolC family protein [Verrucomicrobiota bacterium]
MKRLAVIFSIGCLALRALGTDVNAAPKLTLQDARRAAMTNHPAISVAMLRALAARESVREARAAFLPNLGANIVAVGTARDGTRLAAAGGLGNPAIFERNAEGLVLSQLVTDFGRSGNLLDSARSRALAEESNTLATRAQIRLQVDAAFYEALQARSVARVADQTLATRALLLRQVSALADNKLRSELDVRFAQVQVDEGNLLSAKARAELAAARFQLANLMGSRATPDFDLADEIVPTEQPEGADGLVARALGSRPDLARVRHERDAARRFAAAEGALQYPTLSVVGSAGVAPVRDPQIPENYAAGGITVTFPLFAGNLYSARKKEAALKARSAEEALRDAENTVVRDVRITHMHLVDALARLRITARLVESSGLAYDLARARYAVGASSMLELNQAQLALVSAEIAEAGSRYDYLSQRSLLEYQTGQ